MQAGRHRFKLLLVENVRKRIGSHINYHVELIRRYPNTLHLSIHVSSPGVKGPESLPCVQQQ
ncbi:hypothetical protein M408DRAFT_282018 [Serendipita vermifera MAFF 305830]|uniref:Uncharacterized protein n=1 Tax=Serendipita vermifera MAFF 305830 TaxID=933852 RepID=A0A0C2W896_SERVB|nr:hypothetical protein M408DRAFT_282018 [Serendipita vermifera MAFF 305830]